MQMMTVSQVAVRLNVSPRTVYRMIARGVLRARNIARGAMRPTYRIECEDLDRLLQGVVVSSEVAAGG